MQNFAEFKAKKRENRAKKRQLAAQLREQNTSKAAPLGLGINLSTNFMSYAINETIREIKSGDMSPERAPLLRQVISSKDKINPTKVRA